MNRYYVSCIAHIPCVGEPVHHHQITKCISEFDKDDAIWKLLSIIENDVDLGTICDSFRVYQII